MPFVAGNPNGTILFGWSNEPVAGNPNRQYAVFRPDGTHVTNLGTGSATIDELHLEAAFSPSGYTMRVWTEINDTTR